MMRRRRRFISRLFFLLLLAISTYQPVTAQASIASGTWTGYFNRTVTIVNNVSGVEIKAFGYGHGNLELKVESSGQVTGSLADYHADVSWSAEAVGIEGGCVIDLDFSALDGTVTEGPDHLPVFNLNLQANQAKTACNPSAPSDGIPPKSVVMQAKTASGGKITGAGVRFDTDMVEQVLASVASTGAKTTIEEYWELNFSGASVDVITPEREQYFLEGVPFKNTYDAIVDWHSNPPGTVDFTLNGQSQNVPDNAPASASFELGQVPAGNNPLTVTAISSDGAPSGSQAYEVIIVPLEAWGQKAGFTAAETKMDGITPVVIYRGKSGLPEQPIVLPYLDMSWLPAIGGKWGIPPFQLEINLSANSGGGLSDSEPVTGQPGLYLGGDVPALAIQVDGLAVTNLTPTALLFDHGQVNFNLPATVFERKVGVVDLVPGLSSVYSIPLLGDLVKSLNAVAGISLQTIASATGQGSLGVAADQSALAFSQGEIKPAIELKAQPGINLFGLAWVNVGGGGKGEFTIEMAPNPQLKQCQISLQFSANAGVSGVFSQSYVQPYNLVQCLPVSLNGRAGLALFLPPSGLSGVDPAAGSPQLDSTESSPVRSGGTEAETSQAAGSFETLASGLSAQAAYDLAVGPDNQRAVAYLDLEPGGASRGLRLVLHDGQTWGEPLALSQGEVVEFSPAVGFDGQGQVVVAWVRAGLAVPPAGQLPDAAFAASWEIQSARVDPASGQVVDLGSLTRDQKLDFAPRLAQGRDGSLRLAWVQSPSGNLWGPAGQPNSLLSVGWDGDHWGEVDTVTNKLAGSLGYQLAVYRQDRAMLVADQDLDGDPTTAADREVYAFSLDGRSWQTQPLSQNSSLDRAPLAAFSVLGEPVIVWEQEGAPVSLRGDLQAEPQPVEIEGAQAIDLGGAALLAGGAGDLLLAWPGFAPPQSQVWYSRLASEAATWEPAAGLAGGLEGPVGLAARASPSGEVWIALADQHAGIEGQNLRGLAVSTDLGVVQAALLQPQSGDISQFADQSSGSGLAAPVWLVGLCLLAGLALLTGAVVLVIVMRKRKPV